MGFVVLKSIKKDLVYILLIRIKICANIQAYVRLNVILGGKLRDNAYQAIL